MSTIAEELLDAACAQEIRVRGIVQGVGFRPTVWKLAQQHGLRGSVCNDGNGVLIRSWGTDAGQQQFIASLRLHAPPLARIDSIECSPIGEAPEHNDFRITASNQGAVHTGVAADAATCPACMAESLDPFSRRYRYPFTNCTHCGPRLSIISSIPYDRAHTSMSAFTLCPDCQSEYDDPANRRFHAQPNACYVCGPTARLERIDGHALCTETLTQLDDVDAACSVLQKGHILAIKGIGGYHLACDATNAEAVAQLRESKQRFHKPFALMARELDIIRRYCTLSADEERLLQSPQAPIVILAAQGETLPESIAPGQNTLGFMLPYTPLHRLMLKRMHRPIVLTSANLSDEPQCIDDDEAKQRLSGIAEYVLTHNRDIVNRIDDSVVRMIAGSPRVLRRARGHAPTTLPLPGGFEQAPDLLAMGGELKNTFCLIKDGNAIVSQHMGDLENAATHADYQRNLGLYAELYQHAPEQIIIDAHPEYLSSKLGQQVAEAQDIPITTVAHHHAHIAACLADNNHALNAGQVLGVALDGLGFGEDGSLWGGEFLLADYDQCERVGTFKPVAMLGGAQAMREPWRNTYAHILAEIGWAGYKMNFAELELTRFLESKPLGTFNGMLDTETNSPLASSCGRLFDAVAAAIGICRTSASYEGQSAIELEAIVDQATLLDEDEALAYPFSIPRLPESNLPYLEPIAMWQAVLGDLILKTPPGVMAARFHKGLAKGLFHMIRKLSSRDEARFVNTIALSGGVFQNKILLEQLLIRLEQDGFRVLTHHDIPANDGGLSLGQAAIGAARAIKQQES